ncbi:NF038122 family metalloprotease [Glaciecola sp. 2405UD65-10]|uniref:NF038122 family metalloprotease n=1 Tax=Glaciecola sp. 2405UD65-10 TaxID=3397244 RepID=UPI003B5B4E64
MLKKRLQKTAIALVASLTMGTASAELINLTYDATDFESPDGQLALAGFQEAASFWSNLFTDDVTVNLGIGFSALDSGVIAQASSNSGLYLYQDVAVAMIGDASSVFDEVANTTLPCDDQGNGVCNVAFVDQENPDSLVRPELDNDGSVDNFALEVTQANAKALGLSTDGFDELDANLTFSSELDFDFTRDDGISAGLFDFVGVAIHEIGHALGFVSGVDTYDFVYNSNFIDPNIDLDPFVVASTLDLFRFSPESLLEGIGVRDFSPSNSSYFSIDNGLTSIAQFSTGSFGGDGQQASHFKDGLDLGIMDPTLARGEFADVTAIDLLAFDVIGWDLNLVPVPAPSTVALFGLVVGTMAFTRRRRNK